jgi:hypothetical protein
MNSNFVDFAIEKDAINFENHFNSIVSSKVTDALEAKKLEVAQNFFNTEQEVVETEDNA